MDAGVLEHWGLETFQYANTPAPKYRERVMLVLYFYLGDVMYAVKCTKVREIAPMVELKEVPHAPEYFVGLFNYRGMIVPVVDLRQLIQGQACQDRLSTRIILVDYKAQDGNPAILGLRAERVTEALMKSEEAFIPSSVDLQDAPYLGAVLMEGDSMIQFIDLERLPASLNLKNAREFCEPE